MSYRVKYMLYRLQLLARSWFVSIKVKPVNFICFNWGCINGINYRDVKHCMKLFREINKGDNYSKSLILLYYLCGHKIGFCAKNTNGEIIGVELYYVNKKDLLEKTIHQAFRGVVAEYRGQGIGSALTQTAIEHFSKTSCISGLSSRVSEDNKASLYSNLKLGFEIKEEYYDIMMKKKRFYLVKFTYGGGGRERRLNLCVA